MHQKTKIDPAHKPVMSAVRCQVRRDLLVAFISMMLIRNQEVHKYQTLSSMVLRLQVHCQVSVDHVGYPVSLA